MYELLGWAIFFGIPGLILLGVWINALAVGRQARRYEEQQARREVECERRWRAEAALNHEDRDWLNERGWRADRG